MPRLHEPPSADSSPSRESSSPRGAAGDRSSANGTSATPIADAWEDTEVGSAVAPPGAGGHADHGHAPRPWGATPVQPQPFEPVARRLQRGLARSLRLLPDPILRLAANPYIAGERREQALAKVKALFQRNGSWATIDVLGEDVRVWSDVAAYFDEYQRLVDDLAGLEYANISIKLSALGQQLDEERCFQHALSLVARAGAHGTFVRLDMEDASTTDGTLRIYRRLREMHDNCGVVLQSRLFRTASDVEALRALRPNVRLCIGIYREPPTIALQDKTEMKRKMLELLPIMWRNGQHVGLATHEEWVIREALQIARDLGKPDSELEVQMLLGVPREALQRELMQRGIRVRLYVPYGTHWRAYSMRRLENNPDVMSMVAGNLLRGVFGKR